MLELSSRDEPPGKPAIVSSDMSSRQHREVEARRAVMTLCADATETELDAALADLSPLPMTRDLRPVETGMVMLRGRAGGDGSPFNVGEATVTRAAIALDAGQHGFAYHLGRDPTRARKAAVLDALWQVPGRQDAVERALTAVRDRVAADLSKAARRAAATRVNFLTLARGED